MSHHQLDVLLRPAEYLTERTLGNRCISFYHKLPFHTTRPKTKLWCRSTLFCWGLGAQMEVWLVTFMTTDLSLSFSGQLALLIENEPPPTRAHHVANPGAFFNGRKRKWVDRWAASYFQINFQQEDLEDSEARWTSGPEWKMMWAPRLIPSAVKMLSQRSGALYVPLHTP